MNAYYIQVNLICVFILFMLNRQMSSGKGMIPAKLLMFRRILWGSVVICVSDCFAWLCNGADFSGAQAVLYAVNIIYFASITWVGYAWLNYVNVCLGLIVYKEKRRSLIALLPALAMTALLLTNPLTHWIFTIDEANVYSRGPFTFLHWIFSWIYLLAATLRVFARLRKATARQEKNELKSLLGFIVWPAVAAVVQMIFYGVTTTQCGIVLSLMMIVSDAIREQVSNDVLTGLNNRRAFENYVDEQILKFGRDFTILMCDIDKFKTINDTYGHEYGDITLKRIAGILKDVCGRSRLPIFLCRYGGDEFVICGTDLDAQTVHELRRMIGEGLSESNREHTEQGDLSISIGVASGVCWAESDVDRLIRSADQEMYKNKNGRR